MISYKECWTQEAKPKANFHVCIYFLYQLLTDKCIIHINIYYISALTNMEMTGHAVSFLTDGYETSSGVMAFTFFVVWKCNK